MSLVGVERLMPVYTQFEGIMQCCITVIAAHRQHLYSTYKHRDPHKYINIIIGAEVSVHIRTHTPMQTYTQ